MKTILKKKYAAYQKQRSLPLLFLLCAILAAACNNTDSTPDVSGIKINLETYRFDRDLASIDTNHIAEGLARLDKKYPDFLPLYLDTIMAYGVHRNYVPDNPGITGGVHSLLTYPDFRRLFDTVGSHFPDTRQMDEDLKRGFQYLVHYVPGHRVPKVMYIISLLNGKTGFTTGDSSIVGLALDMYLGPQYPFYASVQHPAYKIRKFLPQYAAPNVFMALYEDAHPFVEENRTLLDMMLQRGSEQYFLSRTLPFLPDSVRFGFTGAQMKWVEANESMIYATINQQNLLYERAWNKVRPYVNDGPNTPGMPDECPANVGAWIGYRMIKEWEKKHKDASFAQLVSPPADAQKYLEDSGYKP